MSIVVGCGLGGCQQLPTVRQRGAQSPMASAQLHLRCVYAVPGRHAESTNSSLREQPVQMSRSPFGTDCTIVQIGQQ